MPIYVVDASTRFHLHSFAVAVDLFFTLSFARDLVARALSTTSLLVGEAQWLT
jgi:hypothetical protein